MKTITVRSVDLEVNEEWDHLHRLLVSNSNSILGIDMVEHSIFFFISNKINTVLGAVHK